MPRIQKVEGFVLKKKVLLEQDILVTLFTEEFGKIVAMAKGARKITSRRAAHLQTGNLITAQLSESHDMYFIQSTEILSGFMQIKTEQKLNVLYLYLFIMDKLLPERQQEKSLYILTKRFFIQLSKDSKNPNDILQSTLLQTLDELGYLQHEQSLDQLLQTVENNIEEKLPRHVIM